MEHVPECPYRNNPKWIKSFIGISQSVLQGPMYGNRYDNEENSANQNEYKGHVDKLLIYSCGVRLHFSKLVSGFCQ